MSNTINYKEVLKLAKSKNFDLVSLPYSGYIDDSINQFLDLSYIQKWLRDIHKIQITVRPFRKKESNKTIAEFEYFASVLSYKHDRDFTTETNNLFEESLLQGIYEALQLI